LAGPDQNGRPAGPIRRRSGIAPFLNHAIPVTSVPNGNTNDTAIPISHELRVLSHQGPKASGGCRATLMSAAIPSTKLAIPTSQITPMTTKNPANGSMTKLVWCASFIGRA
jgi:hypothetical protein